MRLLPYSRANGTSGTSYDWCRNDTYYNQDAKVENTGTNTNAILEFYIPKGNDGNGEKIIIGKTETLDANARAKVIDTFDGNTHKLDFYIPQGFDGVKGEKGDIGPNLIEIAYIATFTDTFTGDGIEVKEMEDLPLTRKEIDTKNTVTVENNKIKFTKAGHFKVFFKVNAYVKKDGVDFDATKGFVAIGFKPNGTDNIYVGGSIWTPDEVSREITAQGILAIVYTNTEYSLVNLGKKSIYLKTPDLNNINSDSYFVNLIHQCS